MNNDKYKNYEKVENAFSQSVVLKENVCCPVCESKDIVIQKGEGHFIIGLDFIAIICNNCRKVYGFNDVKFKSNCPEIFKKI